MEKERPGFLEQIVPPLVVALVVAALGAGLHAWYLANRNSEVVSELKREFRAHENQSAHKVLPKP